MPVAKRVVDGVHVFVVLCSRQVFVCSSSFEFIMSRWGDEKTIQFIHLYKEYECLWNPSSSLYKNKIARDNAYTKIQETFKVTLKEIKNKIKSLRSTYHQELNKVQKSKSSGAGLGDVYKPGLTWFKEMEFLNDTFEYRQTIHTQVQSSSQTNTPRIEQSQQSEPFSQAMNATVEPPQSSPQIATVEPPQSSPQIATVEPPQSSPEIATVVPPRSSSQAPTKKTVQKRKRVEESETLAALARLENISATINASSKEDEFYYFGQNVAAQLRSLPLHNALDLQSKIQTLISTERSRLSASYSQSSIPFTLTRHSEDTTDSSGSYQLMNTMYSGADTIYETGQGSNILSEAWRNASNNI